MADVLTPLEIHQKTFSTSFLGYSKEEVKEFLEIISQQIETTNKVLREYKYQDLPEKQEHGYDEKSSELNRREELIARTLLLTEQTKQDVLNNAKKEAENIVREAELKARKAIDEAKHYLNVLEHERMQAEERKRQFLFQFHSELRTQIEQIERDVLFREKPKAVKPSFTMEETPGASK